MLQLQQNTIIQRGLKSWEGWSSLNMSSISSGIPHAGPYWRQLILRSSNSSPNIYCLCKKTTNINLSSQTTNHSQNTSGAGLCWPVKLLNQYAGYGVRTRTITFRCSCQPPPQHAGPQRPPINKTMCGFNTLSFHTYGKNWT